MTAGVPLSLREPFRPDRSLLTLTVIGVAALAWAVLAWSSRGANPLDHHGLGGQALESASMPTGQLGTAPLNAGASGLAIATVLLGWALMVVAMMLPPALPMLDTLRRLVAHHRHSRLLVGLGAAGFVTVWTVAGTVLIVGDAALHAIAVRVAWLTAHPQVVAGAVLVGAGLYQFTPLKNACLRACRTPRGFAVAHWRGRRPAWLEAATVTGAYALSCVGCCWALMAVSFAIGAAALPMMMVLTVLMAAERLAHGGHRLVRPIGVAAIALGTLAILIDLLPADLLVT